MTTFSIPASISPTIATALKAEANRLDKIAKVNWSEELVFVREKAERDSAMLKMLAKEIEGKRLTITVEE